MTDLPPPAQPALPPAYGCNWLVSHAGLDRLLDVADASDALGLHIVARQMFNDGGRLVYPLAALAPDGRSLAAFVSYVGAAAGMDVWFTVSAPYYQAGVPFAESVRHALAHIPHWEAAMRRYADHNAAHLAARATPPAGDDRRA